MDLSTQTRFATFRAALLSRASELKAEIRAADLAGRGVAGEREPHDTKDEAARHSADAIDASEEQRDIDELRQVQAALRRLDAGAYGDCADCDEPIALERLRVQPAADRCAACQKAFERGHGASIGMNAGA